MDFFGAEIGGSLSVGGFSDKFDYDTGRLTDPEMAAKLRQQFGLLVSTDRAFA